MTDLITQLIYQNKRIMAWLFIGSLIIGFAENDVLPNADLAYQEMMTSILWFGMMEILTCLIFMFSTNALVQKASFAWKMNVYQRGLIANLYVAEVLTVVVVYILTMII